MPALAGREDHEREMALALIALYDQYSQWAVDSPHSVPWERFRRDIQAAIRPALQDSYEHAFLALLDSRGSELGQIDVTSLAYGWSFSQSTELANQIVAGVRQKSLGAISIGPQTEAMVRNALSDAAANVLAATEVTRAVSAAEVAALALMGVQGQTGQLTAIWYTEADARVCPICAPLDGRRQEAWQNEFPTGPPAHPNCRCHLEYTEAA